MLHNSLYNKRTSRQFLHLTLLLVLMLLSITACHSPTSNHVPVTTSPQHLAITTIETKPTPSSKDDVTFLIIDGSELIAPVTRSIAEEFMVQYPFIHVVIDSSGTWPGFKRLCSNEVHITEAFLWIRDTDRKLCNQNGIQQLDLPIAENGFGNFVSVQNGFVECLTASQNRKIWQPTNAAHIWSEVASDWPSREIHRYAQLNDRGSPAFADDPSYEDAERLDHFDTSMIEKLAADPLGIGVFSTAYYVGNAERIRPIGVYENGKCIVPDPSTAEPGEHPVWGFPIYLYVNRQALRDHQPLRDFLEFYMTKALSSTQEHGFFALSPEDYESNREMIRASAITP
ncbi:MAG: hypothetical protein JW850_04280 [Thermoflexales bacterium]|nr:hypothetical protein [Thermoflexales bacterium]